MQHNLYISVSKLEKKFQVKTLVLFEKNNQTIYFGCLTL